MHLTEADHQRVSAAVTEAELHTDGEIVTVVAAQSDGYTDVALHWAVLAMLLALAVLASWTAPVLWLHSLLVDAWSDPSPHWYLTFALVLITIKFVGVRLILLWTPLRLLLTPGAVKTRRVHKQALALFRTAAEKRTKASTGVLLYLSLAEHRAEIIADEAIHSRVRVEVWGEAMAALITAVKQGRPGDGMAEAVTQIGKVLAEHFPRSAGDTNELPDRLIEL
ncbi:hypothetical protein MZO42_19170 [Sphingomonas psychrotolerans]|uniref:TPM domain-containing protein n=1 Tax=Sphingomonas psychrotolerans TaxID=1327635 RepID=A0ABU3N973_9SPHN|nr:hypothetical protein [Sphingomonas psychrotolerans]MDT8760826.1 hypothetical protein [Sphingomonas psychrotolerans]